MLKSHAKRRLRVIGVLTGHVLMPIWLIGLLATIGNQDSLTWLILLITSAIYIAYISLAGAWSWFGIYAQRALPLLVLASAFITRPRFRAVNNSPQAAEVRLLALAAGIYFLLMMLSALWGRRARRGTINLTFPLRGGTFILAQGGSMKSINRHARHRSQRYAIEVVKVGDFGMRANGIYPIVLKKYAVFGAEVVSPCEGIVSAVVEKLEDQIPSERDLLNPLGNHIAIESEGVTIYLAHLMKDSATVDTGQRVRAGKVLGRVGNSGNSSEPHLHIHAERDGYGIPMRFNGRFLVRNDSVEIK